MPECGWVSATLEGAATRGLIAVISVDLEAGRRDCVTTPAASESPPRLGAAALGRHHGQRAATNNWGPHAM
jgi:hypothetical protein